jgi:hypothetical protein
VSESEVNERETFTYFIGRYRTKNSSLRKVELKICVVSRNIKMLICVYVECVEFSLLLDGSIKIEKNKIVFYKIRFLCILTRFKFSNKVQIAKCF